MYIKYINIRLQYIPALVLLYISGLPAIIIVAKLIELFNSIKKDNPFIRKNVDALKTISVCSLIISIEYIIGIFVVTHSIFAIIVVEMFVIAWLGSYVLAELLQEAISFKEENDLTI